MSISQSAFARCESNFGGNDVSFEINFREKEIFKYVHVQMALPKKISKCFFGDEMDRASDISRGRGPAKFRYFREIPRNPPEIFPNTCRQNIFNTYLGY